MNAYNFSERVRKVLQNARVEAMELRHEYVGTEHMLLGLCDGGGVAEQTLRNLGVDPANVRQSVLETVKPGPEVRPTPQPAAGFLGAIVDSITPRRDHDMPYTSRAKRVLELAMVEARELHHSYVGTEHLLMGLIREERGIAAQTLAAMGLTVPATRKEILRLLGTDIPVSRHSTEKPHAAPLDTQATITLVVEHRDGRIEAKKFRSSTEAVHYLNNLEG